MIKILWYCMVQAVHRQGLGNYLCGAVRMTRVVWYCTVLITGATIEATAFVLLPYNVALPVGVIGCLLVGFYGAMWADRSIK